MSRELVFSPEAVEQLAALYAYLAGASTPATAARYTEAIISYCESLQDFPYLGTMRDDVRAGLRITHYRKRAVIAFDVDAARVSIIGVFYGGQNHEAILRGASGDPSARDEPERDVE